MSNLCSNNISKIPVNSKYCQIKNIVSIRKYQNVSTINKVISDKPGIASN